MKHKTIKNDITLEGIGIHSGKKVIMNIYSSKKNKIIFYDKNNKSNKIEVSALNCANFHNRATYLQNDLMTIQTPEHFLAACAAFGITSLDITIDSQELPIFDGSSLVFINTFLDNEIIELNSESPDIVITEHKVLNHNDGCIILSPSNKSYFSYYLSYKNSIISTQTAFTEINSSLFKSEIFKARTFGFENEVIQLKKQGLAKGGSLENALVIGENSYINPPRFVNECAMHKLLDLIGDLWILNRKIIGNITAIKSGHQLNTQCVKYLNEL